jgi:hypothetical protein
MYEKLCFGSERPKRNVDLTLRELEDKVFEITKKQNQITHWGLSPEVEALAIKELEAQKAEFKELMHKKVNNL